MAEKRKLPPRAGREPASKRRVSEAATPQSSKKKIPTPRVPTPPPPPPEPVQAPLPVKVRDGDPLPITSVPQSANLSDQDYQSIAERFDFILACKAVQGQLTSLVIPQRSASGILGAIEEEMAQRWHPCPILHEAEKDET